MKETLFYYLQAGESKRCILKIDRLWYCLALCILYVTAGFYYGAGHKKKYERHLLVEGKTKG
jgi:hypothetical protein